MSFYFFTISERNETVLVPRQLKNCFTKLFLFYFISTRFRKKWTSARISSQLKKSHTKKKTVAVYFKSNFYVANDRGTACVNLYLHIPYVIISSIICRLKCLLEPQSVLSVRHPKFEWCFRKFHRNCFVRFIEYNILEPDYFKLSVWLHFWNERQLCLKLTLLYWSHCELTKQAS